MSRNWDRQNGDWTTPRGDEFKWQHVEVEVLMDIRDELQKLNQFLTCPNVAGGFRAMIRADKRLSKKISLKGA